MNEKKTLLEFYSKTCRPCSIMEPLVKEICEAAEDVILKKIEISEDPKTAEQYKIKGVPAFVLLSGGTEIGRLLGTRTRKEFEEFLSDKREERREKRKG